ncbi:MAG: extracellular solute-binding protein [Actinophytocola sp.]|uniref:ABC transporter substrate-binding protein n=1 Tax=Actinophytocola sp. TaxID=1872138 RepID=UPI001324D8D1|nr:ABC transporter substrate-binding protein [Actinophytocola sp.]MPZ79627.1 extracellular solute-binding protein [Actinophytocola sp.]
MSAGARARTAALLAVAAVVLAGCGDDGGSGDTGGGGGGAAPALEGRGPITFATGKDTSGNMQKLIDQWNTEHPDEKVTITELPEAADEQRNRMIQNAQVESDEFSVLNLDVIWTAEFAANRWVVELPQDEFKLDDFLQPAVDTALYRDKLYAVPIYSDGGMLFYRKDLLTKAGVAEPPKTWGEMKAACDKVKALPEAKSMGCYAGQFDKYEGLTVNFSEAVQSAGGTIVDDSGKPTVNSPEAKEGLDFLVNGLDSGEFPQAAITYKEEEGRRAFQDGQLIFHRQWPYQWALANATDGSSTVAGKFDVAPLPGKDGPGVSTLGGHNFAISAFAPNKATALDFIKFFSSEEAQKSNLVATSQAPTLSALYDEADLKEKFPYLPTLKASIDNAMPRPKVVKYGDVTAAMQEAAYGAMTGVKPVDQALSDLQTKLEELTAE